jgi:hypothetical protein
MTIIVIKAKQWMVRMYGNDTFPSIVTFFMHIKILMECGRYPF